MAYGLPSRGQSDWDDELNNSVEALRSETQTATSVSEQARSNATQAIALAQDAAARVETISGLTGEDGAVAVLVNTPASETAVALSATYVSRVTGLTTDGTGNNTTLLQAAIDAASTAGGGEVLLPRGTIRANVTLPAKVVLIGEGPERTTLKAVAGSNAAVVQSANFATLTGKAYAAGDINLGGYSSGLRNLTIDGDKATQASGWAVRLWGRSLVLDNVQVQNGKDGGIWTEFTTHDAGTVNDLLESWFDNIKTVANGGDGWRFRGPHDSVVKNLITVSNTGWGFKSESAASSYTGGVKGEHWNSWLNANSFYFGAAVDLVHADATGTTGTGIELVADSGAARFTGMIVSGHPVGVLLRGTDHQFSGVIQGASDVAVQVGSTGAPAGRLLVDFTGANIGDAIRFVDTSGPGIYRCRVVNTTTLIDGFGSSADSFDCWSNTESRLGLPGTGFTAVGWSPQYPASNGILRTTDTVPILAAGSQQTLPAAGVVTANDLRTALINLGLCKPA